MVAVDPILDGTGVDLALRKSQLKFPSKHDRFAVIEWSKFRPSFLNRQIIVLLSARHIADEVFLSKQNRQVQMIEQMQDDEKKADVFVSKFCHRQTVRKLICSMLRAGFKIKEEPFLERMLLSIAASKTKDLRGKARILVERGALLFGVIDETNTLKPNEVYVQITRHNAAKQHKENTIIITGAVVVAKNPAMHIGDVRTLQAVKVSALSHLVNVLVFSQQGMCVCVCLSVCQ